GPDVVARDVDQVKGAVVDFADLGAHADVWDNAERACVLEQRAASDRQLELQARGRNRLGVRRAPEDELGPQPDFAERGTGPQPAASGIDRQPTGLTQDNRDPIGKGNASLRPQEHDVAALVVVLVPWNSLVHEDGPQFGE